MSGMGLGDVSVLDVGHGNCVLLAKGKVCCVIDSPTGTTLIDTLLARGIDQVDGVFISHADADHVGGVIGLLSNPRFVVGRIFVNADMVRRTETWRAFRVALRDARRRGGVAVQALTTDARYTGLEPDVRVAVLAPEPELALGTEGLEGERLSANSLSAVVLVEHEGVRLVLVPGDLDDAGLRYLLDEGRDLSARVLLFPHHGGVPGGGDANAFATALCGAVRPAAVLFSLGRGRFKNPNPDVIAAVMKTIPDVYIACTQLSTWCAQIIPANEPGHLAARPARGRARRACCAGTIVLTGAEVVGIAEPLRARHREFIQANAPTPLCMPGSTRSRTESP